MGIISICPSNIRSGTELELEHWTATGNPRAARRSTEARGPSKPKECIAFLHLRAFRTAACNARRFPVAVPFSQFQFGRFLSVQFGICVYV